MSDVQRINTIAKGETMIALIIRNKRGIEERFAGEFEAVKKRQDDWVRMLRWASLHPDSEVSKRILDRAVSVTLCWSLTGEEQLLSDAAWPIQRPLRPDEWLAPDGTIATNCQGNPA